jgi:hypothetical protein
MEISSLPTGFARDHARYARRKRSMPRNNDTSRARRVLEYIMIAAVTFGPPFPLEPSHDFQPVGFGLGHGRSA